MADIDVEDENILTTIFKDSFPGQWQENPDFIQYLVELSSFGAEKLAREPERLAEEKAQILAETQDLAFHNYTTFIQTADCSKEIFQDFQIIEQHLEGLLSKLPAFSEECGNVIHKAQEISWSRRMNTLTLQRHTQLLEVLEIPQLMDTCVRNSYYEEALELAGHVKRLEKKHPNIPVLIGIVQEVKASTQLMLNQLIQQLRTNLQLPACLRIIGFLRRMDVFTEAEIRIKFLQARDSWFQSILAAIPTGDAYAHITKTIEASRVHLFDIMTQFRAIFSDEDPLVSTGREDSVNETMLFHSWVLQKISQFLETLERDLEEGIGGRLDSILGQCMYFGLSFGRVGADFRGLLAPVFEKAALQYFAAALKTANKKFEDNMQSYNLLGPTTTGGLPLGVSASQRNQLYPPTSLLDFYPLAAYCNHILTAFNDLRLCSSLTLAGKVTHELLKSLEEVNRVILSFHRAEETTFNAKEKDQFEQFCATYAADLLPFLNRCLQSLFPPAQLATTLGLSVSQINKLENIGQVNLSPVLATISHLMPAPPPPSADDSENTISVGQDPHESSSEAAPIASESVSAEDSQRPVFELASSADLSDGCEAEGDDLAPVETGTTENTATPAAYLNATPSHRSSQHPVAELSNVSGGSRDGEVSLAIDETIAAETATNLTIGGSAPFPPDSLQSEDNANNLEAAMSPLVAGKDNLSDNLSTPLEATGGAEAVQSGDGWDNEEFDLDSIDISNLAQPEHNSGLEQLPPGLESEFKLDVSLEQGQNKDL